MKRLLSVLVLIVLCCSFGTFEPNGVEARADSASHANIDVAGAQFEVIINSGSLNVSKEDLIAYVRDGARAVVAYYGFFPVDKTVVYITPTDDDGVGYATSTHDDENGYGLIEINIGENTTRADLEESWTMTHELMHLGFPVLRKPHRWIVEGIATYIEPIGRMRVGKLTRQQMWSEFAESIRKGLPRSGDGGLNYVQNYGRMYWGGALYCFLADVEIRKQTKNRMGLEEALRAVAKEGGTAASDWNTNKTLRVADAAVGGRVLEDLYDRMAETPSTPDIGSLMKSLGIEQSNRSVILNDRAPLAYIRKAIEGVPSR